MPLPILRPVSTKSRLKTTVFRLAAVMSHRPKFGLQDTITTIHNNPQNNLIRKTHFKIASACIAFENVNGTACRILVPFLAVSVIDYNNLEDGHS